MSHVVGNRAGAKLSKVKGRGVDIAEVRAYQPGDDIRSIDWRVTARTNKPHTKIFREERERPTLVVLDQTQNMFFGSKARLKSVAGTEIAARIAWQTLAAGDRVGGVVIGNDNLVAHRPRRSTKSVARLLNDVASFNTALTRSTALQVNLDESLMRVRRLARGNYRVFVISDFRHANVDWHDHLKQIAKRNQVVVVHVSDALDAELPPADHYQLTDGSSRLHLYTGDRSLRNRYRTQHLEHVEALKNACLHDAMRYIELPTDNLDLDNIAWL